MLVWTSLARTFPSIGGHFAVLDGLRGVALLLVVCSHASLIDIDMIPGVDMSGTGKTGVWLFFVLSSFLLMHQFLHLDANGRLDGHAWKRYALRRAFRIYPLYTVFLLVCWLTPLKTYFGAFSFRDVIAHLLVIDGFWHTWSVAVELKWYLLLPLLVLAYLHLARSRFIVATMALAAAMALREWWTPEFSHYGLATYVNIFLVGSWVAFAHHHLAQQEIARGRAFRMAAGAAAAAIFILIVAMTPSIWERLQGEDVPLNHWHRSFTLFGMLWGAFVVCVLQAPTGLQAIFAWAPLRVMGVVSFSAYLWHGLLLANLEWLPFEPGAYARAVVVFAALVAISVVSYLLIERPFLKIGRAAVAPPRSAGVASEIRS